MNVSATDFPRRMPSYRFHEAAGAQLAALNDAAIVAHYGDAGREAEMLRTIGVVDLGLTSRCGFKGAGAPDWLAAHGVTIPEKANTAARQADGGICSRLGGTDMLVCADPLGSSSQPDDLLAKWTESDQAQKGWDAHRESGFAWHLLTGAAAPELLARHCAVDLAVEAFPDLSVAQTSAFELGGVITRADLGSLPAWHLYFDVASNDYLIEILSHEASSMGGGLCGRDALRAVTA